jgi:hypothetical protein
MENTITKQGVDFDYQVINEVSFYDFLDKNLKSPQYHNYQAYFIEAQNDLMIGNGSYELTGKYTKSGNVVFYNFYE